MVEKIRSIITPEEFDYLRILHQDGENVSIEHVRDRMAISRSSADKYRNCLAENGLLNSKGNGIQSDYSCYLGISVKSNCINYTVVGLNGQVVPWLDENGTIKFINNSIEGFVETCEEIKVYIDEKFKSKNLQGICFSFDDVDKEKDIFYLSNIEGHFKFADFIRLIFSEYKHIHFSLISNVMSLLYAQEFPFKKSKNDRVCIMQTQSGVYAAEISNNKVKYGFNKQTHNISDLLDGKQLERLATNKITGQEEIEIYESIVKYFMIISNAERISILKSKEIKEKEYDKFVFYLNNNKSCIRNYLPDITLVPESRISYDAAISAMYYSFGWNETMI